MRRILTLATAVAVVGAGLAATSAEAAPPSPSGHRAGPQAAHQRHDYTPPPIEWGPCASTSLQQAGAECGMVTVPLDYDRPRGTKIQLAVSRIEHTAEDYQGVMLVNPGGPGGSGLGLARLGQFVPNGGGAPYDWIGFDPRGVGSSVPSLSCDSDYFAPGTRRAYTPGPGVEEYWLDKAEGYAEDCADAGGALLEHDKTTDWVQDMESIRKALGERQINYYGFSYGTYLGQVYATLYPHRVRRFVFDGVVDPTEVWYEANLAQERQFDPNINTFFDWIAENDAAYGLGTDGDAVRQIYYDVLADLTRSPEPDFSASDWNDVFVGAAYYVYDWDAIAHILVAASEGDLAPAKEYYGAPGDATYATYMAVECTDNDWPSWRTQERDAYKLAARYPFLTWNNTWYNAPCLTWEADADRPVRVSGKKAPPILMIAETEDAATPFEGALQARKLFPRSRLIEGVGGTTHSGSLSGVACTDDRIADYLLTGALPQRVRGDRSDVQCDPVPAPEATAPAPAAAAARSLKSAAAAKDRLGDLRDVITQALPRS